MKYLKIIIYVSCASFLFMACNQPTNNKVDGQDSVKANIETNVKVVLKNEDVNRSFKEYTLLKDALVLSNVGNAQQAASALSESLTKIDGCDQTASLAKKIAVSSDIEEQRKNFVPLSSDLIALLKHTDIEQGTMYVQYCPMANSGEGAYWITGNQEIKNPYYGDKMLNCGEVKESITKK